MSESTAQCRIEVTRAISKWALHSMSGLPCIALASSGKFIAVTAGSSLSFWDTITHRQIGSSIQLNHQVRSLAISDHYNLAAGGELMVSLRNLVDILPLSYLVDVSKLLWFVQPSSTAFP